MKLQTKWFKTKGVRAKDNLAEMVGVKTQTLSRICNYHVNPKHGTVIGIAREFDLSVAEVYADIAEHQENETPAE